MQKNILKSLIYLFILSIAIMPVLAQASVFSDIGSNLNIFNQNAGLPMGSQDTDVIDIIIGIINILLTLLGLVFIILILYAGFTWMTAAGDSDRVKKAQTTIKNSIIGVAIILCAYLIANYVVTVIVEAINTSGNVEL